MKTHPLDFLLAALLLSTILSLALAITAFAATPLSEAWLGDYHVVADTVALLLSFGLLSGFSTRLLLWVWPIEPGDYSMDHPVFMRWKLLTVLYEFGRGALLPFSMVFARPLIAKLFGAQVGRHTALGGRIADPPLVALGDEAILGHNSVITGHAITSGQIILRRIKIGRGATIGVNAVIMPGVEVGDGAIVASGAVVALNTQIPAGELWGGIPARKVKDIAGSEGHG